MTAIQTKPPITNFFPVFTCELFTHCFPSASFNASTITPLLHLLKSSMRSTNPCLTYLCIAQLFNLLNLFAEAKSPTSAIIYKILVFFCIEKHD
jgi:hypothetical protein